MLMPNIRAGNITVNYDQQGYGPPLVLIPYLAADHACYAFQVPEYAKQFTCVSIDLRGTGETDKPQEPYSFEVLADDVAAFMHAAGIPKAHVFGLSFGASVGTWLAAKYPDKVLSLSLHSAWSKTDPFLHAVVESWRLLANAVGVPETVIRGMFPWCFRPEVYTARPELIDGLSAFVRSRSEQALSDFMLQSDAVLAHDAEAQLARITAPTQITFGRHDRLTSTRFADVLTSGIRQSELVIFEDSAHVAIYDSPDEFNQKTLAFLQRCARLAAV
jgi:pimeloyl-ACP methyl ester carboxylesterase